MPLIAKTKIVHGPGWRQSASITTPNIIAPSAVNLSSRLQSLGKMVKKYEMPDLLTGRPFTIKCF